MSDCPRKKNKKNKEKETQKWMWRTMSKHFSFLSLLSLPLCHHEMGGNKKTFLSFLSFFFFSNDDDNWNWSRRWQNGKELTQSPLPEQRSAITFTPWSPITNLKFDSIEWSWISSLNCNFLMNRNAVSASWGDSFFFVLFLSIDLFSEGTKRFLSFFFFACTFHANIPSCIIRKIQIGLNGKNRRERKKRSLRRITIFFGPFKNGFSTNFYSFVRIEVGFFFLSACNFEIHQHMSWDCNICRWINKQLVRLRCKTSKGSSTFSDVFSSAQIHKSVTSCWLPAMGNCFQLMRWRVDWKSMKNWRFRCP